MSICYLCLIGSLHLFVYIHEKAYLLSWFQKWFSSPLLLSAACPFGSWWKQPGVEILDTGALNSLYISFRTRTRRATNHKPSFFARTSFPVPRDWWLLHLVHYSEENTFSWALPLASPPVDASCTSLFFTNCNETETFPLILIVPSCPVTSRKFRIIILSAVVIFYCVYGVFCLFHRISLKVRGR